MKGDGDSKEEEAAFLHELHYLSVSSCQLDGDGGQGGAEPRLHSNAGETLPDLIPLPLATWPQKAAGRTENRF